MKLLYLRTHYWFNLKAGGSVTHTAGVINALKDKVDLEIISNDVLEEVKCKYKIIKPIRVLPKKLDFINEILYNIYLFFKLKDENFDVIYQRYNGFSFIGAMLSSYKKKPFVLEFNSSNVWTLKHWKSNKFLKSVVQTILNYLIKLPIVYIIENYNLKKANLIVVVSNSMKKQLINKGLNPDKILVNPNGVEVEKFNPNINAPEIKEKYNLKNKVVLGFIGTFGQWHGAENIVEAYGKLLYEYPNFRQNTRLLMIGDGIMMPEVKKRIQKYNIKKEVILTGLIPQQEAPKYLSVCDILINATVPNPDGSEFFGSPTKLFEYMSMGKAIISSNMAQMSEILEDRKTALLVKPGDINELKNAMKELIENKDLREHLGKYARKEVVKNYTWDRHVERILDKIKELQ